MPVPRSIRAAASVPLTLALLLGTALPALGVSREGTWKGATSQDRPMRLEVNAGERIDFVRTTIDYDNADCADTVTWQFGLSTRIREDSTFRLLLVDPQDDRDTVTIVGEFTAARRARGTFRSHLEGPGPCDFGERGTWRLTRV